MTALDEVSDADLAGRARAGDQRAYAQLIARHKHWLYRFVRRYVGDAEDAYDVVQDSFVAALMSLARYDPERPFDVWLRRIALNKCRDRGRRIAVRRAVGLDRPSSIDQTDIVDTSADAEQALAASEALAVLDRAIAALPRGLKEPLVLTALEGLSQKEAGDLLGLSPKAVELRIYRAKQKLAEKLEPNQLADLVAPTER